MMGENDSMRALPSPHPLSKFLYFHNILGMYVCYKGLEVTTKLTVDPPRH